MSNLSRVVNIVLAPLNRSNALDFLAVLAEFALLYHFLFLHCLGPKTTTSRVRVSFHDATLDFCNYAVVTSGKVNSRHKCNGQSNGLSFCSHEDHLLVNRYVSFIAEKPGYHELGTVTDGV